ncbi:uncharacterized protein LOC124944611 [Impatiens glandulifera]|nr:uncharacterized protein LOC124944606 [Impatiens glandulifera]XP_047340866.1 uncharacterized protein LOC124944611 [Impatiens glandulifera]
MTGEDLIGGNLEEVLAYVEGKFPLPELLPRSQLYDRKEGEWKLIFKITSMHHTSIQFHLQSIITCTCELLMHVGDHRQRRKAILSLKVTKLCLSFKSLIQILQEHATIEDSIIFPFLRSSDEELELPELLMQQHLSHVPLHYGIDTDIDSLQSMILGSTTYVQKLVGIFSRLQTLQNSLEEHFLEEEKVLNVLMESAEITCKKNHQRVLTVEECLKIMVQTHSNYFIFFLQGLSPRERLEYLDLILVLTDHDLSKSIFSSLFP